MTVGLIAPVPTVLSNRRTDPDSVGDMIRRAAGAQFVALVNSSTPPVAVTAPVPSKSVVVVVPVVTVPKPVRLARWRRVVMPPVSVSEPPSSLIVPAVMLSAAPIVSAPLLPISSVWLAS